jgi:hypothetical protein
MVFETPIYWAYQTRAGAKLQRGWPVSVRDGEKRSHFRR